MAVQDPNGTDAFDPDTTPQKVSPACAIRYNIGNSPSCLEGGLEVWHLIVPLYASSVLATNQQA
eukprot:scaffold168084_cov18-Tisochrysis_lutea.AAC.1